MLLQQIYQRPPGDAMKLFLKRTLRMDILNAWDANDAAALAQHQPNERLPPVDRTQLAGGDGDGTFLKIDEPDASEGIAGPEVPDEGVSVRTQGIKNLEQMFIAMTSYQPRDDRADGGLQTAGSSDASESTDADQL